MLAPLLAGLALAACGGTKAHTGAAGGGVAASTTTTTVTHTATTPPGTSAGHPANVVSASSGGVSATLHVPGPNPRVNRSWPISFLVSSHGRPASASVRYEFLFAGTVVAHRSFYRFTGHFHDIVVWPGSALGYPLTFRAVVTSGSVTLNLDYPVKVVR
ncbi:MAG: hypothetical protein FWD42_04460 [Solirubrobacterales bacterium]|nr:hypothetical protein [Solirubrobacterales bacterium]